MKIDNPTVSYPNIVMEAASNIVTDLFENKWYEINNISCPDFSVFFLTERIMSKYLENCYFLPPVTIRFSLKTNSKAYKTE